jgi:hypothetical protein
MGSLKDGGAVNSNIFLGAVKNYFEAVTAVERLRYELKLRVLDVRKPLFSGSRMYEIQAMAVLPTTDIPFQEMADEICARVALLDASPVKKITCFWFVCSDKGGIYLHEAISDGHVRYGIMQNSFVVFNTETGNVSFGPGHIRNYEMSERLAALLERHKSRRPEIWLHDMGLFFDECLGIMK